MRKAFVALARERQGEIFTLSGSLIWSLFPIVSALSLGVLAPLVALGGATFFAIFFFGGMLWLRGTWRELRNVSALRDILWLTLLNGIFYYSLYFWGLRYTTPGNASLIALTEILFTFLFFHVWRRDAITTAHILGSVLMILGALVVLAPNFSAFNPGDLLIVIAMMSAPIGNHFQQRARNKVSSEAIMFLRSVIATPFLLLLAFALGQEISGDGLRQVWPLLLINGVIMFGLTKITWIEAIHRISVTKALSLSAISPLFTLLFAWILLGQAPTAVQLWSFLPLFAGVLMLTRPSRGT